MRARASEDDRDEGTAAQAPVPRHDTNNHDVPVKIDRAGKQSPEPKTGDFANNPFAQVEINR